MTYAHCATLGSLRCNVCAVLQFFHSQSCGATVSQRLAAVPPVLATCPAIFSTDFITDRKSQFQGHAAYVESRADVNAVIKTLLADKRIQRATHNIMVGSLASPTDTPQRHPLIIRRRTGFVILGGAC